MRFIALALLLLCTLFSCSSSTKWESTYEQNLAVCTKEAGHLPANADTIGLKGAEAKGLIEEQVRDCMIGSIGPAFTVKTSRGDSSSTTPTKGKAMVLFFWWVTPGGPAAFESSDAELFTAMKTIYRKFHQQADFIGFPFNDSLTTKQYLKNHPLYFPQVLGKDIADEESLLTQNTYPYTIFINTKGRIVKLRAGSYTKSSLIIEEYSTLIRACIENTQAAYAGQNGQQEVSKHTLSIENN